MAGARHGGGTGGIYKPTLKTPGEVGCLASSLVYGLAKQGYYTPRENEYIGKARHSDLWLRKSLEMQVDFGWDMETPIYRLEDFVRDNEEWRIVVLVHAFSKDRPVDVFTGAAFTKTVFLAYDQVKRHMMAISAPREFLDRTGRDRWCDTCLVRTGDLACPCDKRPYRPQKTHTCEGCGDEYMHANDHRCNMKACKSCKMFYETQDHWQHRCPIFLNLPKMPGPFLGEDEDLFDDETHKESEYNLIVYDLESCLVATDVDVDTYSVNENGYFELDGGKIQVGEYD